jgi:hypothetical protein
LNSYTPSGQYRDELKFKPSLMCKQFNWFIRNMQLLDRGKFTKAVLECQMPADDDEPDLEPEENTSDEE